MAGASNPFVRRRRWLSAAACGLWIAGFEIAPNLHIALHAQLAPHSHGDTGRRVHPHPSRSHDHMHGADHHDDHHAHHHDDHHAQHHDAHDHHHDADHHAHHHDDHHAHRGHGAPGHHRSDTERSLSQSHPDHGRHSLAHRGIAVLYPPAALPPLIAAPIRPAPIVDDVVANPPRSRRPARVHARGPPRVLCLFTMS